jgi:ketosteroid isomerase-like protein
MNPFVSPQKAHAFAGDWIAAWNSRDLDRILKHYSADIKLSSPFVNRLINPNQNTIRGMAVLRVYITRALNAYPDLCFAFQQIYVGAESVILEYNSVEGRLTAEMMKFDDAGLITKVYAHYSAISL